ncbi:MAG: hypothetical protein NBV67_09450 [Tagaea sp.]|nr:hypothetical protein [Tagaea sp.]
MARRSVERAADRARQTPGHVMLAEMLLYRLTRAEPWADALGYREGAVRLWSRAGRCARAWRPHLERSRAEILAGAEACARRRTALILGSGVLADVPLRELARLFEKIVLVDVVHVPMVRWRAKRLGNVVCATVDLSGVAAGLARSAERPWPVPGSRYGLDDRTVDFVVSLNLVSQLPLGPCDRVETKLGLAEGAADPYGRAIVEAHLAHLSGFDARVLVLGDRARLFLDRTGRVFDRDDPLYGAALPPIDAEWDWDVAPLGEQARDYAIRNTVFCIRELRGAPRIG